MRKSVQQNASDQVPTAFAKPQPSYVPNEKSNYGISVFCSGFISIWFGRFRYVCVRKSVQQNNASDCFREATTKWKVCNKIIKDTVQRSGGIGAWLLHYYCYAILFSLSKFLLVAAAYILFLSAALAIISKIFRLAPVGLISSWAAVAKARR